MAVNPHLTPDGSLLSILPRSLSMRCVTPRTAARRTVMIGLTVLGLAFSALAPSAQAGVANRGLPHASRSNPLAGMRWGVYTGPFYNSIYPEYQQARQACNAEAARFLAGPGASWITGHTLVVDGGALAGAAPITQRHDAVPQEG